MSTLDKMDVGRHIVRVQAQSEHLGLGRLYDTYSKFFYGKKIKANKVDQATLQSIETIVSELEILIADAQTKVEEILALSEKVR